MKMKCIYIVSKYTKHFMKTFKTNLLGMALAGLILSACSQTGMYETADLMNEQAEASKSGFRLDPFGVGNENAQVVLEPFVSCSDYCISESGPFYFVLTAADYNNGEKVEVRTYNTLTHVVYQFTSTTTISSIASSGMTTVTPNSTSHTLSFPLTGTWKACDVRARSFTVTRQTSGQGQGGGVSVNLNTSYNLVGVCTTTSIEASPAGEVCEGNSYTVTATVASSGNFTGGTITIKDGQGNPLKSEPVTTTNKTVSITVANATIGSYSYTAEYNGAGTQGYNNSSASPITVNVIKCTTGCEESFTHDDDSNAPTRDSQPYTFTYKPSQDMTNVLVEFTFAQGVAVTGSGDFTGFTRNGGGTNGTQSSVWSKTMSFEACKTYTFTVDLSPDCNGNSGNSNVWTDFKVAGLSKKNTGTPNITESCPN